MRASYERRLEGGREFERRTELSDAPNADGFPHQSEGSRRKPRTLVSAIATQRPRGRRETRRSPVIRLERILAPTDFSECSAQAVEYACELGARFQAQVQLLHVVESPMLAVPSPGAPLPASLLAEAEAAAARELERFGAGRGDVRIERRVIRGTPFVEIIRSARNERIDLVVIGTHGRGGIEHILIGSVAERVVRKAPCPVLVVRPEGHQFVMP
jgi:nucleotide-binding universal stress UspA family protein